MKTVKAWGVMRDGKLTGQCCQRRSSLRLAFPLMAVAWPASKFKVVRVEIRQAERS